MILDLNVDHYQCEVFRSTLLSLHFLHRSYSQNLFCFREPLVILFRRRFSRPTFASGIVGSLSEICTIRLGFPSFSSFSFAFPSSSSVPSFRPTGSLAEADMEMGGGDGPYEFRARPAFVLPSTEE